MSIIETIKQPCFVRTERSKTAKKIEGVAHIQVFQHDANFKPWFGAVDLNCQTEEANSLIYKEIPIHLEDGRMGIVKVLAGNFYTVNVAFDGHTPGDCNLLYFVGVTGFSQPS